MVTEKNKLPSIFIQYLLKALICCRLIVVQLLCWTANLLSCMQFYYLPDETVVQSKPSAPSYKNSVLILIACTFLFKCFFAFWLELGNDEAYYWLYSRYLQWNYLDHPPMVAVWIRLFTANLSLEQYEGFLRAGSVVGNLLATWFIYQSASSLHSPRAGWFAAIMYNASFYSGVTAGLYIMPDSPQMVFWTLSLWMIARIVEKENNWLNWLLFAAASGLCIMSKVHGAFLWIGLGGYALFLKYQWLKKPQWYVAFLLTILIISPIFLWNLKYDFATFRFHTNRIDVNEFVFHPYYLLKEMASQVCFNNPVNFILIVFALSALFKKKWKAPRALTIYIFIGLPLAFMLLVISLFRNVTLPHWSGPAYVSLFPLAASWLADKSGNYFPKILKWASGIFVVLFLVYASIVNFYPGTFGSHHQKDFGRGDISLDMYGWREAARQFEVLYHDDVSRGIMPATASLVTSHWWGAHVEYYFARPLHLKMIGLGNPQYLNEYLWTNNWRKNETDLNSAYCIIPSDDNDYVPSDFYLQKQLAQIIEIKRGGKPAHYYFVYRLKGLKKDIPMIR